MTTKPIFWFYFDKPFKEHLFEELSKNSSFNPGIAISFETYHKMDKLLFSLNRMYYKIPVALYVSKIQNLGMIIPEYIDNSIFLFTKKIIEQNNFDKKVIFRINATYFRKEKMNGVVEQLSEFFFVRSFYPNTKIMIEICPSFLSNIPGFIEVLLKLDVEQFLIPYSGDNILLVKNSMIDSRKNSIKNSLNISSNFDGWRKEIDELDHILIETLGKRMQLVNKMGELKKQLDLPFFEPQRWQEILHSRRNLAKENNLDDDLTTKIFESIHLAAIKSMIKIEREK